MDYARRYGPIAALVVVCSILVTLNFRTCERKRSAEELLHVEELANRSEVDSLKESVIVRERTIQALRASNDSLNKEILDVVRKLKIKESRLKSVSLIGSKATKSDTIIFRDTIFREDFKIDTTLHDEWYKLDLQLSYPSKVIVSPTFRSERYVVLSYHKEYVGKKHWLFLVRWFQKKHTVVKVDVVEKSPYMTVDTMRYIEIIK